MPHRPDFTPEQQASDPKGKQLSFGQPSDSFFCYWKYLSRIVNGSVMEEQSPSAQIPPDPIQEQPPVSKPRVLDELKSWFRDILFAFITAIFIVIFVVQPVKVEGTSMQPRLVDQERIFVNRFIYRFTDIDRGDVVVFWFPKDPNKSFIKKSAGTPGR